MAVTINPLGPPFDFTGTSGGGGGTISGTIAATQVAFGTGADTIGGDAALTYNSTTNILSGERISLAGGSGATNILTLSQPDDTACLFSFINATTPAVTTCGWISNDGSLNISGPGNTFFGARVTEDDWRLTPRLSIEGSIQAQVTINNAYDPTALPFDGQPSIFVGTLTKTNTASPETFLSGGVTGLLEYGLGGVAAIGTAHAASFTVTVYGSGDVSNEVAAHAGQLVYNIGTGYTQSAGPTGRGWFTDDQIIGPVAVQPNSLNGYTIVFQNNYNGSAIDNEMAGINLLAGYGFGDATHAAADSFAIDAGIYIGGFAHNSATDVIGFTTALQIGGTGSPWRATAGSKSLIGTAIDIRDVATRGIYLHNFTSGTAPAIEITGANPILLGSGGAIKPATNDTATLGTSALQFSDLFLAEGGVINWDNGDVTITQTNNVLAIAGTTSVTFDAAISAASTATLGTASGTTGATLFKGTTSGTVTLSVADAAGTWTMKLPTTAGTSGFSLTTDGSGNTTWTNVSGGSGATTALDNLASVAINTALVLGTSDSAALGSTSKQWSDLFLAEGGVINWDNGDATLTQVGDVVTLAGADLKVTTAGNASTSVVTTDATQTITGKTISGNTATNLVSGGKTVTIPAATGTVPVIIGSSGTATSTTNSASETNLAVVTLPANLLGANGHIFVEMLWKYTGTNSTKAPILRHNTTSGATSSGTILYNVSAAATTLQTHTCAHFWNTNATNAQIAYSGSTLDVRGWGIATAAPTVGAIDTTADSFLNFNASTANSGDTAQLVGYTVIFYPAV